MNTPQSKKKTYAIANLTLIVLMIAWNYISNAIGINGNTAGSVSDNYVNLFTPASYAFSIWGLIFLSLLAHGIFQVKSAFSNSEDSDFILQMGLWLLIANIANIAWVWFWLNEITWFTVPLMLTILCSLLTIVVKLNMQKQPASTAVKRWVWLPISLYSGWITVATIANISAYLAKIDWSPVFSESVWAVIMLVVATVVNLAVIRLRNMRVFAGMGVWALVAIAVRHWGSFPMLQWTALGCAIVLILAILLPSFRPLAQKI